MELGKPAINGPIIVLLVLLASACSFGVDKEIAEAAVARFHEQLNEGAFREIYTSASEEFRGATTEAAWNDLLGAVRSKLGQVKGTEQSSFNITATPNVTAVNLTYRTRFTEGTATEAFSWAIRQGKALLVGYRIDSAALVIR